MRKLILLLIIIFLCVGEVFAFAVKVYDEYGNRVGTYRKIGDRYDFYDFYDNKVDRAEDIIKNAPTQKTLSEINQTLYDENMMPIGTFTSGLYTTGSRYYPRRYLRNNIINAPRGPYIVRPSAKNNYLYYGNKYCHPNSINRNIHFGQ